jgi:hypothetical protein
VIPLYSELSQESLPLIDPFLSLFHIQIIHTVKLRFVFVMDPKKKKIDGYGKMIDVGAYIKLDLFGNQRT